MRAIIPALLIALQLSSAALAYDLRSGKAVSVQEGQTITEDLAAAGNDVYMDGRVAGDALLAGEQVTTSGTTEGTLYAAGSELKIEGTIGNDAYIAGQKISIDAAVGDNAVVFGSHVDIAGGTSVPGDLVVGGIGGSEINTRANVGKNLRAYGGVIRIGGTINGDVIAEASNTIILLSNADIKGNLRYNSPKDIQREPGAKVAGRIERKTTGTVGIQALIDLLRTVSLLGLVVMGILLIGLFPQASGLVAENVRTSFWRSALIGILLLIATPIALGLVAMTLVGLPLALSLMALYLFMAYIAQIFAAMLLGRFVTRYFDPQGKRRFLAFIAGLLLLSAVFTIPSVGPFVSVLVTAAGFGAQVLYLFSLRSSGKSGQNTTIEQNENNQVVGE
jgi:hypothetical protein